MNLDKKLIMEGFEDEISDEDHKEINSENNAEILNQAEIDNFNTNLMSDLLSGFLGAFNLIQTNVLDPNIKPEVKILLDSLSDDVALCIGKVQQSIKEATPEGTDDLIDQGEKDAKDIIKEE